MQKKQFKALFDKDMVFESNYTDGRENFIGIPYLTFKTKTELEESYSFYKWEPGRDSFSVDEIIKKNVKQALLSALGAMQVQGQLEGVNIWIFDECVMTVPWEKLFSGVYSQSEGVLPMRDKIIEAIDAIEAEEE